ncbi:MAG: hypothetical protein AB1772_07380 [Candidatus Zixiibacteriota bacterium]
MAKPTNIIYHRLAAVLVILTLVAPTFGALAHPDDCCAESECSDYWRCGCHYQPLATSPGSPVGSEIFLQAERLVSDILVDLRPPHIDGRDHPPRLIA